MKKNILILLTGAAGFLGLPTLTILAERGFDVVAVTSAEKTDPTPGIKWVKANLLAPAEVTRLIEEVQPTHLLHFAWYTAHGKFWHAEENHEWLHATEHLLTEFVRCGGTRVVSSGTCAEYDWSAGVCHEISTPLLPGTLYGECKRDAFLAQQEICAGMSQSWGRIFLPYGPRESSNRLVASVIRSLLNGEPAKTSHGEQVRDLMHVNDIASAFVSLLESDVQGPINVASGTPIKLRGVVETIGRLMHRTELLEIGAYSAAPNDPPVLLADTTRLNSELNWSPRIDLETGLTDCINWWQAIK